MITWDWSKKHIRRRAKSTKTEKATRRWRTAKNRDDYKKPREGRNDRRAPFLYWRRENQALEESSSRWIAQVSEYRSLLGLAEIRIVDSEEYTEMCQKNLKPNPLSKFYPIWKWCLRWTSTSGSSVKYFAWNESLYLSVVVKESIQEIFKKLGLTNTIMINQFLNLY